LEIPKAGEELKYGSCPWYGMDIFWNCPFPQNIQVMRIKEVSTKDEMF